MPLYNLFCHKCDKTYRKLLKPVDLDTVKCLKCGTLLVRKAGQTSVQMLEVLDNGAMVKRLERFQNAEELYKNRDKKDES